VKRASAADRRCRAAFPAGTGHRASAAGTGRAVRSPPRSRADRAPRRGREPIARHVPVAIREKAGFLPGTEVDFELDGDGVRIV
jgi:hypothetical protein